MKMLRVLAMGAMLAQGSGLCAQTSGSAPAQRPASPNPAPSPSQAPAATLGASEPGADTTTAAFGDWLLRCRQVAAGQSARSCEVIQSVILQGQTAPFAQLSFGRLGQNEPLYFTAVVPTNVAFPSAVRITIDEKDNQPVDVAWTRCLPGGCFASVTLKDDVLKRWRGQSEGGRLTFRNGAGQDTVVPISFRGLARALDALAKER